MTRAEVLKQLKAAGTAQNQKIYRHHGVTGPLYGVSYAELGKLKKKIGVDHALAETLWASGNHDARVLAAMVADPEALRSPLVESWAKDLSDYPLTDALAGLVSRTPLAQKKMEKWTRAKKEWIASAGWHLLAKIAMEPSDLDDSYFEDFLGIIERDIQKSKNRIKHSMNNALIAIGIRNAKLEKKAIATAKRIGKVDVDHGETSCKTPEATAYIKKARDRKRKRARGVC